MITHRPSTLKNANKIYVISENKITESGDFDKLLAHKGEFYKFYQAQIQESEEKMEERMQLLKYKEEIKKRKKTKEKTKKALKLSPVEQKVLHMYYEEKKTYAKIGKELGMEPYDINLIRKSADEKLERLKELEIEE
jgi:DNA-directed RNA polymerase specialized sigma subunit